MKVFGLLEREQFAETPDQPLMIDIKKGLKELGKKVRERAERDTEIVRRGLDDLFPQPEPEMVPIPIPVPVNQPRYPGRR